MGLPTSGKIVEFTNDTPDSLFSWEFSTENKMAIVDASSNRDEYTLTANALSGGNFYQLDFDAEGVLTLTKNGVVATQLTSTTSFSSLPTGATRIYLGDRGATLVYTGM